MNKMDRRTALKQTFIVLGSTTISATAFSSLLTSCQAETPLSFTPAFFSETEARTLESALDALIPATDTPGALDAGLPVFIDKLTAEFMTAEDKAQLQKGLQQMDTDSQTKFGKAFARASKAQQEELLTAYDQAAFGKNASNDAQSKFFKLFKSTAVTSFCSSQVGATQFLQHQLTPGEYTNCIPVEELNNTSWYKAR